MKPTTLHDVAHTGPDADPAPGIAFLATGCPRGGQHEWLVVEEGYSRWWHTTITGSQIRASFNGSGDWSESGSGEHLECQRCRTSTPIPDGFTVEWD